jgi:hypothetical protein
MTFRWSRRAGRARRLRSPQRRCAEGPHSVSGGHGRGIEQLGPPSSRACPEGGGSLRLQAKFGEGGVRVSRGGGQRVAENAAVETCVLLGGKLTQLLKRVPLRHIHQVAGGCTAEQRESLVGGHLFGVEHPAERQLHRFADACVMGASTTTNRPSDTVTASRIKPGSRRSTRTWAPSAPKATTSASASRVTSEGSGVNKVHILGRSIHQIVGEHRATSGQGNLPGLRQRQGDPGDLLMQRAQAHDATTPSRGSHTCRTWGGSHSLGHNRSNSSRLT